MEDVEAIATTTKPKMNVLKLAVVQVNMDFNLYILEILILKYELAKFTIYQLDSKLAVETVKKFQIKVFQYLHNLYVTSSCVDNVTIAQT